MAEQIAYYRARAPEYDDAYRRVRQYDRGPERNEAWRAAMAELVTAVEQLPVGGDVLELGGGTGFWTVRLARRAARLTVVDAAPEALALSRQRLLGEATALPSYVAADIVTWRPRRAWDACFAAFFLNHVPDGDLDTVVGVVAAATRDGGTVVVVDELPADRAPGCEIERRRLEDGRTYRIVKHPRSADEWTTVFARHGIALVAAAIGGRFLLATGRHDRRARA